MSTAIAIGASTLQLPDPGENYSLPLINNNNTAIAAEVNADNVKIKTALKVLGIHGTSATWGTMPTLTSDLKVIFGSQPLTTDASGYVGVDMPSSFANGYIVVSMSNGDIAAQANINVTLSTGVFSNLANRFYVGVKVANTGAALSSGTFRLGYLAIGW